MGRQADQERQERQRQNTGRRSCLKDARPSAVVLSRIRQKNIVAEHFHIAFTRASCGTSTDQNKKEAEQFEQSLCREWWAGERILLRASHLCLLLAARCLPWF